MTPEKREELTQQLADQGLSVLLTRDFDSILIQLARLAQFERLMITNDHLFDTAAVKSISRSCDVAADDDCRPMEILDIPTIEIELHRALHAQLDKQICINPFRVHAAVTAFIGILCAEAR